MNVYSIPDPSLVLGEEDGQRMPPLMFVPQWLMDRAEREGFDVHQFVWAQYGAKVMVSKLLPDG